MLLSAKKDAVRFKTLHTQLGECVRHVADMVSLRHASEALRGGDGVLYNNRMAEVAEKVGHTLGCFSQHT